VGSNARCPRFCSVLEPFEARDVRGEHVWCNPDYAAVRVALEHFLSAYRAGDSVMSGTFVLPVWMDRDWWRLLRGARVVRAYPAGSDLFTSPDWRELRQPGGHHSFGGSRARRGPTRWPVVVVHFPPPLAAGGVVPDVARCPVLRGSPARDAGVLRRAMSGVVSPRA
jgi:hypothetical protein